jgi:hypothetical protein
MVNKSVKLNDIFKTSEAIGPRPNHSFHNSGMGAFSWDFAVVDNLAVLYSLNSDKMFGMKSKVYKL